MARRQLVLVALVSACSAASSPSGDPPAPRAGAPIAHEAPGDTAPARVPVDAPDRSRDDAVEAGATPPVALAAIAEAPATPATPPAVREHPALDIEYVPTPPNVVRKMLDVAKIGKDDVVYDLGCGDGRLVIAAAKRYGVRAFGFDLDPVRVAEARANVAKAKLEHLVTIEEKNIFDVDLSGATVVTLYLLPSINVRLLPQLAELPAGARVVSHDFGIEGVPYDQVWTIVAKHHRPPPAKRDHYVYRWIAPLVPAAAPGPSE